MALDKNIENTLSCLLVSASFAELVSHVKFSTVITLGNTVATTRRMELGLYNDQKCLLLQ